MILSGETGPKDRLSRAPGAPAKSERSHQPVPSQRAIRLTSTSPGRSGSSASTIHPGRTRRVRNAIIQSP